MLLSSEIRMCEVQTMLKIGEFSKLSRISIRMLRHYDEIGLLRPVRIDAFTGYRYYGEDQLPLAGRIAALRDMGFGLNAISEVLACGGDALALERLLACREGELLDQKQEVERQLRMLESLRRKLREEKKTMQYNVNLKTIPERYAACVRQILPRYDCEGVLWDTLMGETAQLNLIDGDPCICCAVLHDGEYKEADVDVEVQKSVEGSYADTEHVQFKTLPAVTVASATYQGGYHLIGEVSAAVAAWVRDNDYHYDGPAFYIYHVSPHETDKPEEFITEICLPVRRD